MPNVIVYDSNLKPAATLENAFKIGYEQRLNEVWTAQFTLPATDPKNAECQPFRYVEIFDGGERVDLFRIIPDEMDKDSGGPTRTYNCEHVLATLLDDIMFQYHQTTNLSPADTIDYVLGYQSEPLWEVGTIDFTDMYSYKWENENLLSALFLMTKTYTNEYMWTFDTTVQPWKLNLVRPEIEPSAGIRYRHNLVGIKRKSDPTYIVTRLYPLGYGEGVNQLTIESVNSGIPYIDSDTQSMYGIKAVSYVDKTEEDPAMLLAKAQAYLEENKIPRITYDVSGADIYQITEQSVDHFNIGGMIQVYDDELGLSFASRVVVKGKEDITGDPGAVDIQISNKVYDSTDTDIQLKRQIDIGNIYSQGAVNIDSNDYQDNCDEDYPAVIEFYIPEECININKCLLTFKTGKFRAYERSIESAPSTTSGSSSKTTTESGGAIIETETGVQVLVPGISQDVTVSAGDPAHTHGLYNHGHQISIGSHSHGMQHTHGIPSHTHGIDYGIYEYSTTPTSTTVKVDGNIISGLNSTSATNLNIMPYLSTDEEGQISRGSWHTVEITPNNLARITASVVKQIFVQSR